MPLFGRRSPSPPPVEQRTSSSMFSRKSQVEPAPVVDDRHHKGGLFSRKTDRDPVDTHPNTVEEKHHGGLFSRNRTSVDHSASSRHSSTSSTSPTRSHGFLHRGDKHDPSITAAWEQVRSAEAAEADADRALVAARHAVKEAKAHVKRLELEAAEEARLARIKQDQAAAIGKRGNALGRHG